MSSSDWEMADALVKEGWNHLQLQRPQAAWACWRRALGYAPSFAAAEAALAGLEKAPDLPAVARTPLRFQPPQSATQRKRWDELFRDRNMDDLDDAAEAFAALAVDDPEDASAWYNLGICRAWQGQNSEAVDAIERVVALCAGDRFSEAVNAWTLAELLRHGAGAERLADDLAHARILQCAEEAADAILAQPGAQAVPPPVDPSTGEPQFPDAQAYTWLDRPIVASAEAALRLAELPRVLAQIIRLPGVIRLSSPDPHGLERLFGELMARFGGGLRPIRHEVTPLPLPLLDGALWTFRLPPDLDPAIVEAVSRGAVEQYYENFWIHLPRHGLDARSPLAAARAARAGDMIARAKLAAIVQFREQLGQRPWTAHLYQGYPFDRLRRRLGLPLIDPEAIDDDDFSCMSEAELGAIEPGSLDELRLTEAYESAAALRDDHLAARFAAELARRDAPSLAKLDTPSLIATLVREAMKVDESDQALDWLDQARTINRGRNRQTYDVWSAEVYARTGAPAAAVHAYQELLDQDPDNAALALDAAETLIDNGFPEHARTFLLLARDRASRAGDALIAHRAETLLEH
jgi:tetratricopeptide (TPR) repeat protein